MNATTSLPEKDLPPGRHQQIKEHLMREIRHDHAPTGSTSRRTPWLRPVIVGPAAAGALALAVLAGVSVNGTDNPGRTIGRAGPATSAFAPRVNGDTTGGAADLLNRIAMVAAESHAAEGIRDDQYVYVRSRVASATVGEGIPTTMTPLHLREVWRAVDGSRPGLVREPGQSHLADGEPLEAEARPGELGYESTTNYRHLSTLPTDPDAMYRWLRAQGDKEADDRNLDQDAFVLVSGLLRESLMPPRVGAALYRAAARIPGVLVVPNAVTAADRHGVAIVRYDSYNPGVRDELIFDKDTLRYIGSRRVATKATDSIEAGQVLDTSAVLETAVVDRPGMLP
ncbi:CU044_5270 family protein [Embleya sp. NPDC050154]|uniref:CU044_5270 family protein n=1 Tax=Embleya sp. NPDC050154 TaxID=3363988 RepID=UPI00379D4599